MRWWLLSVLIVWMTCAQAEEVSALLERSRNARAEGLSVAMVHDLERALADASGGDRVSVAVELARCLIDTDREAEAVKCLDRAEFVGNADAGFWLAQARAKKGDYEEALALYAKVAAVPDFEGRDNAAFGAARMLDAMGKGRLALNAYEAIPESSRWHGTAQLGAAAIYAERGNVTRAMRALNANEHENRRDRELKRYLTGRLMLEDRDFAGVREQYDGFAPRNRRLAAGAAIGEADALIQQGRPIDAEKRLEAFIWDKPPGFLLPEVMAKLDEARSSQKDPSNATLKRWENDAENAQLSLLATYYLARSDERDGRTDRAVRTYEEFLDRHPNSPLRLEATVRLCRLLLERDKVEEAVRRLDRAEKSAENREERAALRFLGASAYFRAGNYEPATKMFVDAANMDAEISEVALSNAALAAIRAGNEPLAAEVMNALFKEHPDVAQRVELAQAMQSAALENPDAGEQLSWIANQGGSQSRAARVAAAEWRWMHDDRHGARADFLRVANSGRNEGNPEQEAYFGVYLADDGSPEALDAVSMAAEAFLGDHPDSGHEADVRMKWGEVLSRSGNHGAARVQFELAAAAASDPALADEAAFLAGREAKRSMDPAQFAAAIELFERVAAGRNLVLAEQARFEQASLRNALGQPREAVKLLDSLIAGTKDERVRTAARLMKARTLISMSEKASTSQAVEELRTTADAAASTAGERNEALVRLAGVQESQGDFDAAMATYYEVLNAPREAQPEYFWYYTAGFDAGRLLGERNMFREEAAIYERMAAVKGPRQEEAAAKVKDLRLRNFIWED